MRKSDGTLIRYHDLRLARWSDHLRAQFSRLTATVGLPLMSTGEQMPVDTSPPSEMELMRETGFVKSYKAASGDGMPQSFFKHAATNKSIMITLGREGNSYGLV